MYEVRLITDTYDFKDGEYVKKSHESIYKFDSFNKFSDALQLLIDATEDVLKFTIRREDEQND